MGLCGAALPSSTRHAEAAAEVAEAPQPDGPERRPKSLPAAVPGAWASSVAESEVDGAVVTPRPALPPALKVLLPIGVGMLFVLRLLSPTPPDVMAGGGRGMRRCSKVAAFANVKAAGGTCLSSSAAWALCRGVAWPLTAPGDAWVLRSCRGRCNAVELVGVEAAVVPAVGDRAAKAALAAEAGGRASGERGSSSSRLLCVSDATLACTLSPPPGGEGEILSQKPSACVDVS